MTPETVDSIKDALAPLMEKFGATGEYAWQLVVRQQYVEAVRGLVWVLVLCGVVVALWRGHGWFARRAARLQEEFDRHCAEYTNTNKMQEDVDGAKFTLGLYQALSATVGTVLALVAASELMGAVGRLANPEWYALKMLLDTVTGG